MESNSNVVYIGSFTDMYPIHSLINEKIFVYVDISPIPAPNSAITSHYSAAIVERYIPRYKPILAKEILQKLGHDWILLNEINDIPWIFGNKILHPNERKLYFFHSTNFYLTIEKNKLLLELLDNSKMLWLCGFDPDINILQQYAKNLKIVVTTLNPSNNIKYIERFGIENVFYIMPYIWCKEIKAYCLWSYADNDGNEKQLYNRNILNVLPLDFDYNKMEVQQFGNLCIANYELYAEPQYDYFDSVEYISSLSLFE